MLRISPRILVKTMDLRDKHFGLHVFAFCMIYTLMVIVQAEDTSGLYSKSIANFLRIQKELKDQQAKSAEEDKSQVADRRADVLNPAHEGWNGRMLFHLKTQNVPDFGHDEIHSMDERGEKFHLDSNPRDYLHHGHHHHHHHMPHYHHEVHTFNHDGEHPHINHEHYVHHEPDYHDVPLMHDHGYHHGHHHGYHHGHHYHHHDIEDGSGYHEDDHHGEEGMHGDNEDWDVGGGYFQLEEHGSDVNVVALKKHGTKVHMSGGDFNVIRDPWRHHSLFAGLFHPHEMPGHGHYPMEQFHQHFTYIANDRAINHHVYQHHTHNEDHHIHEHDPGHEFDYFYHHPPEPNNHGGKRELLPINITAKAQVKQTISSPFDSTEETITIPLRFSSANQQSLDSHAGPSILPNEALDSVPAVKSRIVPSVPDAFASNGDGSPYIRNSLPVVEVADPVGKSEMGILKEKRKLPKGKTPHLSPLNGNRIGPNEFGKGVEMPFAPIFKREIAGRFGVADSRRPLESEVSSQDSRREPRNSRSGRLKRAFLGKLLLARSAR